jgi:hypothetical protein
MRDHRSGQHRSAPTPAGGIVIDNTYVIKTYRYLRLAMVGLVVFLLFAVLIEWWHTDPHCLQTTLSAYYYTPAQGAFVSALLAIGICMVVIKGNTEIEDVLLNAAGMLAPIAALVPTPGAGVCWSTPVNTGNTAADVANNIAALLAISVVVLAVVFAMAARQGWPPTSRVGVPLAALVVAAFGVWFYVGRDSFLTGAHYVSAIALFVLIAVVVVINALRYRRQGDAGPLAGNPYSIIAASMVLSAVVFGLLAWLTAWQHAILWLEVLQIALFAAFWLIQTKELWDDGLRVMPPATKG